MLSHFRPDKMADRDRESTLQHVQFPSMNSIQSKQDPSHKPQLDILKSHDHIIEKTIQNNRKGDF